MKKISLLVALSFSPQLFAATDLLQVYREALTQDATFQAAKSAQIAGEEKLTQGRALLLPSINLSANTTHNETDTQTRGSSILNNGVRKYNSHGYSVSLNQPLYRPQNYATYAQAKSTVAQTNAQYAIA